MADTFSLAIQYVSNKIKPKKRQRISLISVLFYWIHSAVHQSTVLE